MSTFTHAEIQYMNGQPLGRIATVLGQAASDAVIVTLRRPLTLANTITWPVWLMARSVRIQGINWTAGLDCDPRPVEYPVTPAISPHSPVTGLYPPLAPFRDSQP